MRTHQFTITAGQVHVHAQDRLQRSLRLKDHGPKCTAPALYALLFWAASRLTSIAAACASLLRAPSEQAVYNALRATLPSLALLQRQLNHALGGGLPRP